MKKNEIDVNWLKQKYGVKTDTELAKAMNVSLDTVRTWKKRGVANNVQNYIVQEGIIGNNNIQVTGEGNTINGISQEKEFAELLALMRNYATPALLNEFKNKLLKIKEIHDG
ncbi:MAG: helix-turn-helix domain containing protein [Campylobacteraceae bacterium]|jgi:hypothetical protein|nr:helix-turn-helix domain containing protein [Campylobacteraceae bacterium]